MSFLPEDNERQIEFNQINLFLTRLVPLTADPDLQGGLKDGDIWHRSDLNTFRVKVNGAIQTLVPVPGRIIVGTIDVGDVGGTTGVRPVSGDIISANSTIPGGVGVTVAVTFPSVGSNYMPLITIESLGTPGLDGDLLVPIVHNLTDTSLNISLDETAAVAQNIRFHLMLWPKP